MTKRSANTFSAAETRGVCRAAKVKFTRIELPQIDYNDPMIAQRLWMANIAISWLGKSKSELRCDMHKMLVEEKLGGDMSKAMTEAEGWFRAVADLMQSARARSCVAASANLVATFEDEAA